MALKAYIDGSGSRGQPLLVLAGYIATVDQWVAFTDEWDDWRKHCGLPYFKMSEMTGRPEIAASFYRIIEKHVSASLACALPCDTLTKVVAEFGLPPEDLGNPYYLASKAIINVTAQHQPEIGFNEPIDFIFDNQSEKKKIRDAWEFYVSGNITPEVLALTGAEPGFLDDVGHPPLQAADLYAWWMRNAWEQGGMPEFLKCGFPFPWTAKRDMRRFLLAITEDDIRKEYAKVRRLMIEARRPSVSLSVTFSDFKPPGRSQDGEG